MRLVLSIAMAMIGSSAMALELPLAGSYGNAAGCAVAAKSNDVPPGKVNAVTIDHAYVDDLICPFTGASEPVTEGDVTTWTVDLSCEQGHDDPVPGKLTLAENKAEPGLAVTLEEGFGPKGNLKPCEAAE